METKHGLQKSETFFEEKKIFPSYQTLIFPIQNLDPTHEKLAHEHIVNIDQCLESNRESIHQIKNKPFLVPKLTFLYGPWVCNLKCPRYCYTKGLKTKTIPLLTMKEIIKWAEEHGTRYTYWPGVGETTLLPEFWEILQYQNTLSMPAVIFTNGSIFFDEQLCQDALKMSCLELIELINTMPNLYLYIKVWSTNENIARGMTGVSTEKNYPYEFYFNLNLPKAFQILHSRFKKRIGIQCMVTQKNYDDYENNILPFCTENQISLFAEPIIFSGNANLNLQTKKEALSLEQQLSIQHTFASGGQACANRQFLEMIIVGDKMVPGIAIPPRAEDSIFDEEGTLKELNEVFFNSYFREHRKKSKETNSCLCRSYWNEK